MLPCLKYFSLLAGCINSPGKDNPFYSVLVQFVPTKSCFRTPAFMLYYIVGKYLPHSGGEVGNSNILNYLSEVIKTDYSVCGNYLEKRDVSH